MDIDPYVWIDPWEEIAKARMLASEMYEAGFRRATAAFTGEAREAFRRHLGQSLARLAEKAAREQLLPVMRADAEAVMKADELIANRIALLERTAQPVFGYITAEGDAEIDLMRRMDKPSADQLVISIRTVRPFQYNIAVEMGEW